MGYYDIDCFVLLVNHNDIAAFVIHNVAEYFIQNKIAMSPYLISRNERHTYFLISFLLPFIKQNIFINRH